MTAKTRQPGLAQPDFAPAFQMRAAGPAQLAAFIAANPDFLTVLARQLGDISVQGEKIDKAELGFMVSVVKGIEPRDHLEFMLAAQMAAIHVATMASARRLGSAVTIAAQDSAERTFNKLARTFATQMEALKRHRTGADQTVVQHVSVSEGSQAIVGNVTQTSRRIAATGT